MKKIGVLSIFVILVALAFQGCDKIEKDEYLIDKGEVQIEGVDRVVLIEDYTGHTCVNCPTGAKIIHDLLDNEKYANNLIVIGVHAGAFAEPAISGIFSTDYTTEIGDAWYNDLFTLSSFGNPVGLVNRASKDGVFGLYKDAWAAAFIEQLSKPSLLSIELTSDLASSIEGTEFIGSVNVKLNFADNIEDGLMLNLVLLEDSLISAQLNNNPDIGGDMIPNYAHMHVLRDALTVDKINGVAVPEGKALREQSFEFDSFNYNFSNKGYKIKDCSIVAFVTNSSTKEVLQAAKVHIVNE